jgi:putative peptidoglycan lipid II flippase
VGIAVLARIMATRLGGLDGRRIAVSTARGAAAAAGMGAIVWVVTEGLETTMLGSSLPVQLIALGAAVGAGAASYVAFAHLLRVEELDYVRGLVGRAPPASVTGTPAE